jgi:hypothetical protein
VAPSFCSICFLPLSLHTYNYITNPGYRRRPFGTRPTGRHPNAIPRHKDGACPNDPSERPARLRRSGGHGRADEGGRGQAVHARVGHMPEAKFACAFSRPEKVFLQSVFFGCLC